MMITVKRVRATALRGRNGNDGDTGAQGQQGEPGYKVFATYAAAVAALGTMEANEAVIVVGDSGTHTRQIERMSATKSAAGARYDRNPSIEQHQLPPIILR